MFRDEMDALKPAAEQAKSGHGQIVAVVRTEVLEAQFLEERARHDHVLEYLLDVVS